MVLVVLGVFVVYLVPFLIALGVKDTLLRNHLQRVIDDKINRIKCLSCKYLLIGQVVRDDRVRCPECGRVHHLRELGVVAEDLIPPTDDDLQAAPEA